MRAAMASSMASRAWRSASALSLPNLRKVGAGDEQRAVVVGRQQDSVVEGHAVVPFRVSRNAEHIDNCPAARCYRTFNEHAMFYHWKSKEVSVTAEACS